MPEKMTGTLTLDMSKTLHISIFPKILHKSYSLATIEHPKSFLLKIYFDVVVLASDLYNVSIYSKREFF